MSNKKQSELLKNTVILTVGKICTQFVSFLLLPLYTALLSPEEYGIVDLFNTYIALLLPFFNWQFDAGLFRFMIDARQDSRKLKKIFSTVFLAHGAQAAIYILFYIVAQNFISSEYKIFLAIDVLLNIFLNSMLQFPRGLGNNTVYSIASFMSATATVALNVLLIAAFNMGAYGMFLSVVLSKIITILYLLLAQKMWRYFSFREFDTTIFKQMLSYSLPLIPNQLSWWVISASDRTIISWALGVFANGVYAVANKFSSVFITFYNFFNLALTESASLHLKEDDGEDFLRETINTMFSLFSCICIGIIACMPVFFSIFINEQYHDAYFQIPILLLATLFQVVVGLYSVIYVALKKSGEIAKTSIYSAIINIVVNVLLIRHIGLYAASISTLAAFASMAVYRYFDIKKYYNVPLKTSKIAKTATITIITLVSYYYNNAVINVMVLFFVAVYSLHENFSIFKSIINMMVTKYNSKKGYSKLKDGK